MKGIIFLLLVCVVVASKNATSAPNDTSEPTVIPTTVDTSSPPTTPADTTTQATSTLNPTTKIATTLPVETTETTFAPTSTTVTPTPTTSHIGTTLPVETTDTPLTTDPQQTTPTTPTTQPQHSTEHVLPTTTPQPNHSTETSASTVMPATTVPSNSTTPPSNFTTAPSNSTAAPKPQMTGKAWVTILVVIVVLSVLFFNLASCPAVMVLSAAFFHVADIISLTDLFVGITNKGVLAFMCMYVIVHPVIELPAVKDMVRWCLTGRSCGVRWPLFKLCGQTLILSSFLENTPHVAALTPLLQQLCRELDLPASQFLMPMAFAVLLGNMAVLGSSNNLVVSDLMREARLGPMPFFELFRVNWLVCFVALAYLTLLPQYLLPKRKGGLLSLVEEKGKSFLIQLRVRHGSPLIGKSVEDVLPLIPNATPSNMTIAELLRNGVSVHQLSGAEVVEPDDVFVVVGDIEMLVSAMDPLRLDYYVDPESIRSDAVLEASITCSPVEPVGPVEDATPLLSKVNVPYTPKGHEGARVSSASFARKHLKKCTSNAGSPAQSGTFTRHDSVLVEVVLSMTCPECGSALREQHFQLRYSCTVLALRTWVDSRNLSGGEMLDHMLMEGDTLLLLVSQQFANQWSASKDFLTISRFDPDPEGIIRQHYFRLPGKCCIGTAHREGKKWIRLVRMPEYYRYASLILFAAVSVAGAFHMELVTASFLAAIGIVALGLMTTQEAIAAIDYNVYVMVAFSFGLGIATQKSGLAAVIGQLIMDCGVSGFWLFLLIALATSLATNIITNKASVQVMFPIVVEVFRRRGEDPLAGVMVLTAASSVALSTPYGYATNVIVMGPGGYSPMDYLRFGLPLNIIVCIVIAFCGSWSYSMW